MDSFRVTSRYCIAFLRRFLAFVLAFALVFQSTYIRLYADFTISSLKVNNVVASSYSFAPGATFSMDMASTNTLTESGQHVFANINFSNNNGFSYAGIDQRARINTTYTTSPIPSSAYSTGAGFSYELTTSGLPQVGPSQTISMTRSSNNYNAFTVSPSISTYANNVSAWFTAQKVSDSSTVTGVSSSVIIYANVRPHVTSYSFIDAGTLAPITSVQGGGNQSFDLVLNVKDYNGCANIAGGSVLANLSSLGLGSAQNLTYQSCNGDGKTAVFQVNNLTTLAATGSYNFSGTSFTATDADGNANALTDSNTTFSSEDINTTLTLTVVAASTPTVSFLSLSNSTIGGPSKTSSLLTFSGSQAGSVKVAVGSDSSCAGGTTVQDWTSGYAANASTGVTIPYTSLSEGSNTVYMCVKNSTLVIGSNSTTITRDTVAPSVTSYTVIPSSVIAGSATGTVRCNENGVYQVEIG